MVSPRGTYLVIADSLRKELRGERPQGELPSEAELMEQHGVSRGTVRRSLRTLADEGLVESVPGKGWTPRQGAGTEPQRPLVERVAEVIEADGLEVGAVFPSESRLCTRFGVSRGAVRHALAELQGQGVLAAVHGKGRTVQTLPSSQALEES